PARPEIRLGRCNQSLGLIVQLTFGKRRGFGGQPLRQAIALRGVEHGKSFEKRNRAGRVPISSVALALLFSVIFGREAVSVKNSPSLLALADASASGQGLPECQPVLRGIAAINHGSPQNQDIDARIMPPRNRVARQAGDSVPAIPRLRPRKNAFLQLRDNLRGYLVIKRHFRRGITASARLARSAPSLRFPTRAVI